MRRKNEPGNAHTQGPREARPAGRRRQAAAHHHRRVPGGGVIRVPNWYGPVVIDLANLKAREPLAILLDHDERAIVGQATEQQITNRVRLSGIITGNIEDESDPAGKVVQHAKRGFRWGASVGLRVERVEDLEPGATETVNGKTVTGPVTICRAGTLYEVSVLSVPADDSSSVNIAGRAAGVFSMQDFHDWLKAKGFEPAGLTNDQRDTLLKTHQAEAKLSASGGRGGVAVHAEFREERRSAIQARAEEFASMHPDLAQESELMLRAALSKDETPEMFDLDLFRLEGSQRSVNNTLRTSGTTATKDTLTAGLLIHAGYGRVAEKVFGANVAQRAADLRAHSLVDFCGAALRLDGQEVPRGRDEMIRASFSTVSMPFALGDSASKIALAAYTEAPASWRTFVKIANLKDFKPTRLIRVVQGGEYKIATTGEIKHGALEEETSSVTADTWGELLCISRRDVINDDLGVFAGLSEALGRAGARKVSDEVYTVLLANLEPDGATSFFTLARDNYDEGAGTALGVSGLEAGILNMRTRKDAKGRDLDIVPRTLLVGPTNENAAKRLLTSQTLYRTGADLLPEGNALLNMLALATEPRLENILYTGYSTVAWYLFSAPGDGAVTVGFIGGRETPIVEQVTPPPDVLGVAFRGYIDFGVSLSDWRAAYKAKGSA